MLFRFGMYAAIGLSLEVIFSVIGIEFVLGTKIKHRVPKSYLEGFVSIYMIPIHGLGILLFFEPVYFAISQWHWLLRYCIWSFSFVAAEAAAGFALDKTVGFYPWDYYQASKFKIFKKGYSLWTLLPFWGLYGLLLENLVRILVFVSPYLKTIIV